MGQVRKVFDGDNGIIEVGSPDTLPEQVLMLHRNSVEATRRINELEEQVEMLREALIDLGGPAFERLRESAVS